MARLSGVSCKQKNTQKMQQQRQRSACGSKLAIGSLHIFQLKGSPLAPFKREKNPYATISCYYVEFNQSTSLAAWRLDTQTTYGAVRAQPRRPHPRLEKRDIL